MAKLRSGKGGGFFPTRKPKGGISERDIKKLRAERRTDFIRALAEYLVGNQAAMSIWLEMGHERAREWAKLRSLTPLNGYPTVDEAVEVLTAFLKP